MFKFSLMANVQKSVQNVLAKVEQLLRFIFKAFQRAKQSQIQ